MYMVGQLSPKGRFKPYYGEWLIIDESIPNQLEREYIICVDAGPTGYPAREREDLVQLGFFPCNLSNRTIK